MVIGFWGMHGYEVYKKHLNEVSRSFAFCIDALEEDFRLPVSHMYLVCRVLDTIEDVRWDSKQQQNKCFNTFLDLLQDFDVYKFESWKTSFAIGATQQEKSLLQNSLFLIEDFLEFDECVKTILYELYETMAMGMMAYQNKTTAEESIRIHNIVELNEYCYYVAGIVGVALSKLNAAVNSEFAFNEDTHKQALHFGLFLQKINLLKDQIGDEEEGRYFVFNRMEVLQSLNEHAENALQYVLSIPVKQKGYRKFCLWSLFLALASLPYIEKTYREKQKYKISRLETKLLMALVNSTIDHNQIVERFFKAYMHQTLMEESTGKTVESKREVESEDFEVSVESVVAKEVILNA